MKMSNKRRFQMIVSVICRIELKMADLSFAHRRSSCANVERRWPKCDRKWVTFLFFLLFHFKRLETDRLQGQGPSATYASKNRACGKRSHFGLMYVKSGWCKTGFGLRSWSWMRRERRGRSRGECEKIKKKLAWMRIWTWKTKIKNWNELEEGRGDEEGEDDDGGGAVSWRRSSRTVENAIKAIGSEKTSRRKKKKKKRWRIETTDEKSSVLGRTRSRTTRARERWVRRSGAYMMVVIVVMLVSMRMLMMLAGAMLRVL